MLPSFRLGEPFFLRSASLEESTASRGTRHQAADLRSPPAHYRLIIRNRAEVAIKRIGVDPDREGGDERLSPERGSRSAAVFSRGTRARTSFAGMRGCRLSSGAGH